jgi:hypothetical protein
MFHKPRRSLPKVFTAIGTFIALAVFVGLLAAMILEWMVGCGETYVDSKGVRHRYECVFLTIHNEGVKK